MKNGYVCHCDCCIYWRRHVKLITERKDAKWSKIQSKLDRENCESKIYYGMYRSVADKNIRHQEELHRVKNLSLIKLFFWWLSNGVS